LFCLANVGRRTGLVTAAADDALVCLADVASGALAVTRATAGMAGSRVGVAPLSVRALRVGRAAGLAAVRCQIAIGVERAGTVCGQRRADPIGANRSARAGGQTSRIRLPDRTAVDQQAAFAHGRQAAFARLLDAGIGVERSAAEIRRR